MVSKVTFSTLKFKIYLILGIEAQGLY